MPEPEKFSQQKTARLELEGKNILNWLETGAAHWARMDGHTEPKPEVNNVSTT